MSDMSSERWDAATKLPHECHEEFLRTVMVFVEMAVDLPERYGPITESLYKEFIGKAFVRVLAHYEAKKASLLPKHIGVLQDGQLYQVELSEQSATDSYE